MRTSSSTCGTRGCACTRRPWTPCRQSCLDDVVRARVQSKSAVALSGRTLNSQTANPQLFAAPSSFESLTRSPAHSATSTPLFHAPFHAPSAFPITVDGGAIPAPIQLDSAQFCFVFLCSFAALLPSLPSPSSSPPLPLPQPFLPYGNPHRTPRIAHPSPEVLARGARRCGTWKKCTRRAPLHAPPSPLSNRPLSRPPSPSLGPL